MYCPKCGKELKGTPKFCSGCGAPLNQVAKKEADTASIRKISAKVAQTDIDRGWSKMASGRRNAELNFYMKICWKKTGGRKQ